LGAEVVREGGFMTKLQPYPPAAIVLTNLVLLCVAVSGPANGQILYQDQEVQVHRLPSLMARTKDPSDVLLTSLDTVLHDKEICCGTDSALGESALAADPKSLKDVANKLEGRHLLSDGRPILVNSEYLAPDQVSAPHLVQLLTDQHAALMEWNSHLYVVHGIIYLWTGSDSGEGSSVYMVIRKFLLWDTRYSDARREVDFNRETEDASKVQGLLFLQWKPQ
jgi:hypothetical protein